MSIVGQVGMRDISETQRFQFIRKNKKQKPFWFLLHGVALTGDIVLS